MNLGMIGGLAGIGKGMSDVGAMIGKDIDEEKKRLREEELIRMRDELETNRSLRVDETKRARDKADKADRSARIEERAQGMIGSRVDVSPEDEAAAEAGAKRINDMRGEGLISAAEAEGAYDEIERQRDAKGTKSKPTTAEYMKAQAQEDGDWSKVAAAESKDAGNEMRMEIAKGNWQAALERAQMMGDVKLALAEAKNAAKGGSGAASAFVQEFEKIKAETGWNAEKILDYMNSAKQKTTYTEETKIDPLTGKPITSTKVTRPGEPPKANNDPLGLRK